MDSKPKMSYLSHSSKLWTQKNLSLALCGFDSLEGRLLPFKAHLKIDTAPPCCETWHTYVSFFRAHFKCKLHKGWNLQSLFWFSVRKEEVSLPIHWKKIKKRKKQNKIIIKKKVQSSAAVPHTLKLKSSVIWVLANTLLWQVHGIFIFFYQIWCLHIFKRNLSVSLKVL